MTTEELTKVKSDLAQVARLALSEKTDDVRLFVARLVRQYRNTEPTLAEQLDNYLRTIAPSGSSSFLRRETPSSQDAPIPVDDESRLSLLKIYSDAPDYPSPLLASSVVEPINQLIKERRQIKKLATLGLHPTKSSVFVGAPGVGKTITARWIAAQLGVPLLVLDLTAVMSSLLGKSGANIRSALDYAKRTPCVLFLDEIDAIAKRRSDESDVGELKRLVTVILQEVDEWPSTGLLLAATNHPELIDPALWRRFDLVVEFKSPDAQTLEVAIRRFLGPDLPKFEKWIGILSYAFQKHSFSDIEREIQRFRRTLALGGSSAQKLIEDLAEQKAANLGRAELLEFVGLLDTQTSLSQRAIQEITGISRDTIRKYRNAEKAPASGRSRTKTTA
ncbi:ATP-binding protein [Pseudomonas fluorescens]|uniref:Putative AAA ATPase n=1 Tax=Pseudomonas fluorescens (strain Pf0-1) TaxID=205922 RepID=Q3K472_PSEPF|nr:ATP-binding protein [Pseudomonas fluorescens]ABA77432.1 putative AAA ATPase [Pseudomonas fluorescens Pf0-1]MBY9022624.1 ATP-binding protein [Pseudomonas fluorescens]MBY9028616.1 ATP-binding protein [Pseudomonas fluorescens]MBY9033825.1 ATP-binding protein [Pseudomonas fluorescens]MBY9040266.1 ATP-binding protein [Pseudomonas fluorescens]